MEKPSNLEKKSNDIANWILYVHAQFSLFPFDFHIVTCKRKIFALFIRDGWVEQTAHEIKNVSVRQLFRGCPCTDGQPANRNVLLVYPVELICVEIDFRYVSIKS